MFSTLPASPTFTEVVLTEWPIRLVGRPVARTFTAAPPVPVSIVTVYVSMYL